MAIDVNNPYFKTKVLTASPEELRLMLIEGAIRFSKEGRAALGLRQHEKVYESFSNARNIILELMTSLRHEIAPELCKNLEAIYTYIFRLLTEGSFEKDLAKLDEAIALLEYDRETWVLLMDKLASERNPAATSAPAALAQGVPAGHAPPAPPSAPARAALSVHG